MSNLTEIRQRLDRLTKLMNRMREQSTRFIGPEGKEMKKKAKKEGTRVGIGAGISFFGLIVAAVASLYVIAVTILLVNIALGKLWLSALIVVGGFLVIGGVIIAIGVGIAKPAAKELSRVSDDATEQIKQTVNEIKAELQELQKIAKIEAEQRQKQMADMVETAKKAAPVAAPVVVGACIGYRIVKRVMKSHKERRAILKVIELYEESRTQEERS